MTEMASTPIYGKTLQKFKTNNHMILKLGMRHRGLKRYNINIYEDFELTITYFMSMSIFVVYAFEWENLLQKHVIGKTLWQRTNEN